MAFVKTGYEKTRFFKDCSVSGSTLSHSRLNELTGLKEAVVE